MIKNWLVSPRLEFLLQWNLPADFVLWPNLFLQSILLEPPQCLSLWMVTSDFNQCLSLHLHYHALQLMQISKREHRNNTETLIRTSIMSSWTNVPLKYTEVPIYFRAVVLDCIRLCRLTHSFIEAYNELFFFLCHCVRFLKLVLICDVAALQYIEVFL